MVTGDMINMTEYKKTSYGYLLQDSILCAISLEINEALQEGFQMIR